MAAPGDEEQVRRELNRALVLFRTEPRRALGVGGAAGPEDVNRAFRELAKRFHPARFARRSPPIVRLANEVFLAMRDALAAVLAEVAAAPPIARPASPARAATGGPGSTVARPPSAEPRQGVPTPRSARPVLVPPAPATPSTAAPARPVLIPPAPTTAAPVPAPAPRPVLVPPAPTTPAPAPAARPVLVPPAPTTSAPAPAPAARPVLVPAPPPTAAPVGPLAGRRPAPAPAPAPAPVRAAPPAAAVPAPAPAPFAPRAAPAPAPTPAPFASRAVPGPAPVAPPPPRTVTPQADPGALGGPRPRKRPSSTVPGKEPLLAPQEVKAAVDNAVQARQRFDRALDHLRRQKWADAREELEILAAQTPADTRYRAYLHYVQGWEAFQLGRDGDARSEWQKALACDPGLGMARWALDSTGLGR